MYRSAFERQKTGECVSFTRYKYVVLYVTKLKFIPNGSERVGLSENMLSKAYRTFPTNFPKGRFDKKIHSILTEAVVM